MFRRVLHKMLPRPSLAGLSLASLVLLNLRVPFLRMYLKLSLAAVAVLMLQASANAQDGCAPGGAACAPAPAACATCGTVGCQRFHCPPALKWCMEGMPRICFQHGCPKPICSPCDAPNWGYYQKCWTPWPWPPDWSHCPVPPPASQVFPGMLPPAQASTEVAPTPRRLDARPPL
jgi:hypothetical protein